MSQSGRFQGRLNWKNVGLGDVIDSPGCFGPNFMLQRLTRILSHLPPLHYASRQLHTITMLSDRSISTAGCLVIGDEVLSSKTMDTNSAHFGRSTSEAG